MIRWRRWLTIGRKLLSDMNKSFHPIVGLMHVVCISMLLANSGCRSSQPADETRPRGVDLYVQGVQAYKQGDKQAAQEHFEQATRVNPNLQMAHSMLGDMYRQQGDYDRARSEYETLTHLDPYGAENFYRLGVTDQLLQRFKNAVAAYLRALNLQPNYAQASMNLGTTYLALNQLDDAVKYAKLATQQSPRLAAAWTNLGVVLDAKGDYTEAESAYKKALELDPNQTVAELNLGENLVLQNKGPEAVSVMEQAVKRNDNAAAHTTYGKAITLAGRYDEAITQIDLALKLDPNYFPAFNARADASILLYQKGLQLDENLRLQAIDAWKKSLAVNPNQPHEQQQLKRWTENKLFGQ